MPAAGLVAAQKTARKNEMASSHEVSTRAQKRNSQNAEWVIFKWLRSALSGIVALLAVLVAPFPHASAAEEIQGTRLPLEVKRVAFTPAERVFILRRDKDDILSVATSADVSATRQWNMERAFRFDSGRWGIEMSVPIGTPTGNFVFRALCADPEPKSQTPCLVFGVEDRSFAPNVLATSSPDDPTLEDVLRWRHLPQSSLATYKVRAPQMPLAVLDPTLSVSLNRYRDNLNETQRVEMALAIRRSLMKFLTAPTVVLTLRADANQTGCLYC